MGSKRIGVWGAVLCLSAVTLTEAAGEALLAGAVEKRDRTSIGALLEQRARVNAPQVDGMTALHWAAYQDDLETAELLVEAGANVKAENRYGVTPLSLACTNGNVAMVGLFLAAGADPNTTLRGGESVLMTAARTGKVGAVKALLSCGADVDAKEKGGQTALMWAAAEGHAAVVDTLIECGADFRTPLKSGFTPTLFAVREGRSEVVGTLLKAGVDVNEALQPQKSSSEAPKYETKQPPKSSDKAPKKEKATSPLILAVENGHFDLAVLLLEAGANPNDQRSGFTALHTITWVRKPNRGDNGDPAPVGSGNLSSLQFVKELVAHGADVNARLENGKSGKGVLNRKEATPFLLAAVTADVPLMRLLVELGADPSIPNVDNCTPLMAAAGVGTKAPREEAGTQPEVLEAVQLALDLGGDVNTVDDNGETAMHGAAYKSLPKVVHFLAEKGAEIEVWNHKNKYGWTPLLIAAGYRPGNFKPSSETIAALREVMVAAGVPPPAASEMTIPAPRTRY